ncbi:MULTISPECIES: hypothetical protein [Nocardioides]|uniref:hypothetical protein n=1 Tax=Nocardioides TaxID=1839 RepID=UPI00032E4FC1|nr:MULTISPECIES: hypothetical protein [Nocardioides]EON22390.1 hypothetical protein CF8_3570 [Nocardioides sp. CF8]
MKWHKSEEIIDITHRLRHIEELRVPDLVGPREPVEQGVEELPPLLDVERHQGRMYVAGHEPHFRTVTLLQPVRPRTPGDDRA